MTQPTDLAGRYDKLTSTRQPYLQRARAAAELTIPSLFPKEGANGGTEFVTPFQSIGSRGVNNLAAKLLLSLLPPNDPFFRLNVDDFDLAALGQEEARGEVEDTLASIERAVVMEIENMALRVPTYELLRQLIVAGNVLTHIDDKGVRVFRLDRYVVRRDPAGNLLEIIVKESISPLTLPQEVQEAIGFSEDSADNQKDLDMYTRVYLSGGKWHVYQTVEGVIIPKSEGTYPKNRLPWLALRFVHTDGEDYGRGYVEEYIGDLKSHEGLTRAIVEGSAASAKVLLFVSPNGTTRLADVQNANNGDVLSGNAQDITTLQLQKAGDFRVAQETSREIADRLSFAFLLNSAVQRSGERVTAEEIRTLTAELEQALGGIYSLLSAEFQLPLVTIIMNRMQKKRQLPRLPDGKVKPQIVTGVQALGRGQDLNKLKLFLEFAQPLGAEVVAQEVNVGDYLDRLGASIGMDTGGLIKTDEQKQQAQAEQAQMMQQAQMMDLAGKAAPALAGAAGKAMTEAQPE